MKTMFSVKYVLSNGNIQKIEGDLSESGNDFFYPKDSYSGQRVGRDCFNTREEAVVEADRKRNKKIASLKKQIAKLEKMELN